MKRPSAMIRRHCGGRGPTRSERPTSVGMRRSCALKASGGSPFGSVADASGCQVMRICRRVDETVFVRSRIKCPAPATS